MDMVRQGDVLLVAVSALPAGVKKRVPVGGRAILAYGEATGHHHSVAAADCELLEDVDGTLYLRTKRDTALEHQEHAAIPLTAGLRRVVQQREYHPEEIRNVID